MTSRTTSAYLVASGPAWSGLEARSVDACMREIIGGAMEEIHIAMYSVAPSAAALVDLLRPRLHRGVKATIVLDHARSGGAPSIVRQFEEIARGHPSARIFSFEPNAHVRWLHSKVVVADRSDAIIGSANLSWGGLVDNYEMGVRVTGSLARDAARLVDRLCDLAECASLSEESDTTECVGKD